METTSTKKYDLETCVATTKQNLFTTFIPTLLGIVLTAGVSDQLPFVEVGKVPLGELIPLLKKNFSVLICRALRKHVQDVWEGH